MKSGRDWRIRKLQTASLIRETSSQKLSKIKENQEYEKNTNHRHGGDSSHSLQRDADDHHQERVHAER